MSRKTLTTLVILFIVINLGLFLFLQKDTFLKKETPNQTFQNSSFQTSITLPVDQNHKGVSSVTLNYQFSGKVTDIQKIGQDKSITLDISDSQTPEFLVTPDTFVFEAPSPGGTPRTINDIRIGGDVVITMTYDLNSKTWKMSGISIRGSFNPTPPGATSSE